jgi:hypothetical protein
MYSYFIYEYKHKINIFKEKEVVKKENPVIA